MATNRDFLVKNGLIVTDDITLDDGGSLKEAGGTAAFTFDGSGNVTKIGQDSPSSGEFLKWDGSKWVADAVAGDIEGVTAGDGLTGGGTSGTVTVNVGAGTGIDVAADAISVDVSDFMTNGSNNRILTATGTDAMNAEANLTFDGSTLALTGDLNVGSGDLFVDDSAGKVGIGTTSPTTPLHVSKTLTGNDATTLAGAEVFKVDSIDDGSSSNGPGFQIRLESTNDHNGANYEKTILGDDGGQKVKNIFGNYGFHEYWLAGNADGKKPIAYLKADGSTSASGTQYGVFRLLSTATAWGANTYSPSGETTALELNAGGDSYFNGGSVGIGTTSPSTELHVSGASHPSIRVTGTDNAGADPAIELLGTADDFTEGGQLWYDNGSGILHFASLYNNAAADIQFHTRTGADRSTSNVRMTIEGDGNVGIGLTNPSSLLEVASSGTIKVGNATMGANNFTINNTGGYGSIELTGSSGGYLDIKTPSSDDYDIRIISTGTGGTIQTSSNANLGLNVGSGDVAITGNLTVSGSYNLANADLPDLAVSDFAASAIVLESEGIGSNDNDTTLPTSAAVKDYVDNNAGGSPGGSDTQIQYNNGGSFGGSSIMTFDDTSSAEQVLFSGSSSNPLVKIVQTGGGHAFEVHDAASDTSIFTISEVGQVTIKTATPQAGGLTINDDMYVGQIKNSAGGSQTGPRYTFNSDTNTGMFSPGADNLAFTTGGSERIRYGSSGEIGIAGANYGTSGQVLTSGGSGAAVSWGDVSASPAGSDSQIQYNNGGSLGGDAEFVWDDTNERLVIGSTTSQHDSLSKLTIKGSDAGMLIEKHDAGSSGGPTMTLYRYSSSVADNDLIGQVNFRGEGSTGNPSTYMSLRTEIIDTTEGTKDGNLIIRGLQANTQTEFMQIGQKVQIGPESINPSGITTGKVTISRDDTDATGPTLMLVDGDDDANSGPQLKMYRNTASPADNDTLGNIGFVGEDSAGGERTYAGITATATDVTSGTTDAALVMKVMQAGTQTDMLRIDENGVKAMIAGVKAVSSNTTLTDNESGSYVYWTGGTLTLPATAIKGQQFTVINNTGGSATPSLGTSNSIATGWTAHAAMDDETARTYISVAANTWIYIG
jgi:hypothetical protein